MKFVTYSCCLDLFCDLYIELFVRGRVFAADEDLNWEPATLNLIEILC
jgi:hypothetical protein